MSKINTIETELNRRIDITMNRNGSGHISLTNPAYGDFVQARLTKREIDALREALTVETVPVPTPEPVFLVDDRLVVTGTYGHGFDIGDIVKVKYNDDDGSYFVVRVRDGYEQYVSTKDLKKVSATTPKFSVDDTVVVIGDCNEDYPHKFPVGAKVRIEECRDMDGDYWVVNDESGGSAYVFEGDMKAAPKFSEGDKVRVILNNGIQHYFEIGDIVTVCEDAHGEIIECVKIRANGTELYQGVSIRDVERFTGPELVDGDVYLDEDLDPWTVRNGKLAFCDGSGMETWDFVEEAYGPLKKVAGWHVVLPNGEKIKELFTDSPELFETKAAAEFRAKVRMEALINVGASDTTCKVEPAFV